MVWLSRARSSRLISLWALFLRCLDIAGVRVGSAMADSLDLVRMSAVAGGDATLPCDTLSSQPLDVLLLVAWYRDDLPIYSYDSRLEGQAAHWADHSVAGRVQWHEAAPSSLRIHYVAPTDRALYRCRVDFKISPTQNYKVQLDVIELPEKPKIFDEFDKEISLFTGPFAEDSSMKLTCVVSGGRPMPRLRWWRNEQVVSTLAPVNDGSLISLLELRIPRLTRDFYEAVFACTADNTALAPPQKVQIQLQLYLRPLFVEILTKEQPLSVDQRAELTCRAVGSRPPALISWWLEDLLLSASQRETVNVNESLSVLRWTPRMEQNGKRLICRATHEKLEQETIETSITLNLYYIPVVQVQYGSNMNPRDIEEGDDVYFECIVQANPPAYKVVWEHNGQLLAHNPQMGLIIGSSHLALQKAKRHTAGKYSCTASNVEGDGRSPDITLSILYKPTCNINGMVVVGAALNELTRITCDVDAFPMPRNSEWQWTLNNSFGSLEISSDKFTTAEGRSILSFTPTSDGDYGAVNCRASNAAGKQAEPCRYTVLPAVRPDPLFNCSAHNHTDSSLELKCFPGYNSGLHTVYLVEAWESGSLILNLSNPSPVWRLRGLGAGKPLKLVFYASNARGRSETVVMKVYTLTRKTFHADADTTTPSIGVTMYWMLGVLSGIAGSLLLVLIIAVTVRKSQQRPIQYAAPVQTVKNHSPLPSDDKNPDVVPLANEVPCSRVGILPPEPPPYKAVVTPSSGFSKSIHSLHRETSAAMSYSPSLDAESIEMLGDWRSIKSGTHRRSREVVTTRTPLLAHAQESCV